MKTRATLVRAALFCLAVALPGSSVLAQQKQQISLKVPAENTKYTQQLNIDVGDGPNHIVRVFELTTPFRPTLLSSMGLRFSRAGLAALRTTTMGMVRTRSTLCT
jgi:hypothetical protein